MKPVTIAADPAAATFGNVRSGDTVVLQTRDGRRARFVVQQVDGDTIVAPDGGRFTRGDIAQLQRRSFSGWKTGLLVAGTLVGVVVLALAAAAASLADNIG